MKAKLLSFVMALGLLAFAPAALADYPDDCLGEAEPSGGDCGDVIFEGCCDDQNRTLWCDDGELFCLDCGAQEAFCGWMVDINEWYGCMDSDTGADPSGTYPLECVACDPACEPGFKCEGGECVVCEPDCGENACGSDGCGGECLCKTEGDVCNDGECCTPTCGDKVCGDNGCGDVCGECDPGKMCTEAGACEDLPECALADAELKCDDVIEGDTTSYKNVLDDYSCAGWDESGPEVGYAFKSLADDLVKVTIEYGEEADLDVFALGEKCTIDTCIANGNTEIEFETVLDGSYHIVVDGFGGDAGPFTLTVWCMSTCEPSCEGKECGDNGCMGECACANEGDVCVEETCCTPSCDGKECGDDGCGGDCGACTGGQTCTNNTCGSWTPPDECTAPAGDDCGPVSFEGCCDENGRLYYCEGGLMCVDCNEGDGSCGWDPQGNFYNCGTDGGEDPSGANPKACGFGGTTAVCGDGTCSDSEDCAGCPDDCGCADGEECVDGICMTPSVCSNGDCEPGEDCANCEADCGCADGETCTDGVCTAPADCGDGTCGADESCTSCPADCGCADGQDCVEGVCQDAGPCGDGTCAAEENCLTCAADCACADGFACSPDGECIEDGTTPADAVDQGDVTTQGDAIAADVAGEDDDDDDSDGCSTSGGGNPFAAFLLLFALLGMAIVRRVVRS